MPALPAVPPSLKAVETNLQSTLPVGCQR